MNSDFFLGGEAKQWKCAGIKAEPAFENNVRYFAHKFLFQYCSDTWIHYELDRGFSELVPDPNIDENNFDLAAVSATLKGQQFVRRKILDENQQPFSEPQLLDGNGKRLEQGADPVWLQFDKYRPLPFTPLLALLL